MFRSLSCLVRGSFIYTAFTYHFFLFTFNYHHCFFLPILEKNKIWIKSYYKCDKTLASQVWSKPRNSEGVFDCVFSPFHSRLVLRRHVVESEEHGLWGQAACATTPTLPFTCRWPRAPSPACLSFRLLTCKMEMMRRVPAESQNCWED